MKTEIKHFLTVKMLALLFMLNIQFIYSQQVEVQGELKVTNMTADDTQENLVVKNTDGTLGTRSVASLPLPPSPIDTTRNLASDFELAKHMCNCGTSLPPFLVESLLSSGYTEDDLLKAGVPYSDLYFTCGETFVDYRNGITYGTIQIGNQCWMSENMNIGTMITGVTEMNNNNVIEKYCFDNDPNNCDIYGGLYQWDEMMQYTTTPSVQGICPTGWHLPSDDEWKTLEIQVGMTQVQADAMGFRGTNQGSQLAGNEVLWGNGLLDQNADFGISGFEGLPSGSRNTSGGFNNLTGSADFWTSNDSGETAWDRILLYDFTSIYRGYNNQKSTGLPVRCVMD